MLRLKADSSKLSQNGSVPNDLFSDISTRSLNSVTVGENSGKISRGSGNAFVGFECGNQNVDGSFGVFIGYQAGQFNKNGNWNTFVGSYTGRQNSRGDKNTFVGFRAGELNLDGSECVAIGANAMRENSVGNRNVAVGINAGERILEGDNNTMVGTEAGQNIRSGNLNTMAGYRSGKGSFKGNENTYFGAYSGYSNEFGDANAFIGYKSGEYLSYGSYNVAVGAHTLQYATEGSCNIAIGAFSGSKVSGTGNVFVGTGAAANTSNGNYNTNVGTNSGYDANGDNNVYIGYNVSKNTIGNRNVAIGSSAFSQNISSNSVVIGYNAANTVFRNGSNNIFIGVGADSHTSRTSFAIAIGSENTRSGDKAISIGENIENGGVNSLLLGYDMYSDSDQCVSIGYKTQINNVSVFNDPLNYIFPVNSTTEYYTFDFTENYTDMLDIPNKTAIATIIVNNIYDSGCNLLKGVTRENAINLLDTFNSNTIYHNITILHSNINITPPFITGFYQLPNYNFIINNDTLQHVLNIPFQSDTSNLIPVDPTLTRSLNYQYTIGRRLSIDTFNIPSDINVTNNKLSDTIFITNLELNNVALQSFEINNFFDKSRNRTIITHQPLYGDITITNEQLYYNPYPEALYKDIDTFKITIATIFDTYTVISEDIPEITLRFTNKSYPVNTNINFHKEKDTVLDLTNYNIIEFETDTYVTFIPPSNVRISDPEELLINTPPYTYFPIVQNALSYSNITIIMDTFSLESNIIPVGIEKIIEYPKYGYIDLLSNTYVPETFNFNKDTFKGYSNDTLFTIDILTQQENLKTNNLNIIDNPPVITFNSNVYYEISPIIINREIFTTVLNTTIFNGTTTIESCNVRPTNPYESRGYIHTSNTNIDQNIRFVNSTIFLEYLSPIDATAFSESIDETTYYDYFVYNRDGTTLNNPNIRIETYNWDYSTTNGFGSIIGSPIQISKDQVYSNINNLQENRYFVIDDQRIITKILYKEASNITILNSNIFYDTCTYVDNYNNYIYTERTQISKDAIITSNATIIYPSLPFFEEVIYIGFSNEAYTTSNISTILLRDNNFYKYDGIFNVSNLQNNTVVLQKNIGAITTFYQSNITNNEIHIWGQSNLYLTDTVIPIMRYSNIEIGTDPIVEAIDFRKREYISDVTIIYTENISFLGNIACVGDGDVFVNYINSENKSITQHIPSSYRIQNPINLNIGSTKVATKLKQTDMFFKIDSQDILYTITQPHSSITFYKNNVATLTFTQNDINNERVTIEGTGNTDTVTVGFSTGPPLTINKYVQNAYLSQSSSNTTSNIITQTNNNYTHQFIGSIWKDLEERRDDMMIYILNNPVSGFLYSSNTASIVNTISYNDFKTQKINYIPYTYTSAEVKLDLFFSYSNVASPVYSITIQNVIDRVKTVETITQRPKFIRTVINIDVDESSYTYFNNLLTDFVIKPVIFYIVKPPDHGVILNNAFLSVSYFTSADIIEKRVFYQNFKGTETDTFHIRVATNPYDLSLDEAIVILNILPLPKLLKNNYDYIYNNTITDRYYPLDSSKLEVSLGGVYIYEKEYMDVYVRNADGVYNTTSNFLKTDDVYYRPSIEFFQFNSNENRTMVMKFFTYNNVNIREPSPLIEFDVYRDLYVQEWFSKYNTFDSKNEIIRDIRSNQRISYTLSENSNLFKNKKCKIQFDYKPSQSLLDLENFGDAYNDFLKTYKYEFIILDFDNNILLEVDFENTSNVVKFGSDTVIIPPEAAIFDWNRFYMITNDDTNDDKLSIYINDINYTDYTTNLVNSVNLENLKEIRINVNITDPKNNYTNTLFREINEGDGSKLYYNLINYNTTLEFKNFQILLGNVDLTTREALSDATYNIAIGDFLQVNGYNNICIGKNFLTTGTGSIIIGNDIGSSPDTTSMLSRSFNEVFNSIIISTSSFIETKVRGVIAIGNEIFNYAGGSEDIDLFFSKNPVLIGNKITPETIDFHVNIQNSFLKTNVGFKQIYCGLEQEALCIGYSNNMSCNNDLSKLYVNGNVNVTGTIIEKSVDRYRVRYVYPSRRFTENIEYGIQITWENTSIDIHDIISLDFKLKFIGDISNYGYYNFENVINVATNTELYSIIHNIRGNVTHTVTPLDNGVNITLNWTSAFTDYLLANLEVEAVCLNTLGNLVFA